MGFEHRIGPLAFSKDRQDVGLDMQRRQQGFNFKFRRQATRLT
jgi:hypothetical protein